MQRLSVLNGLRGLAIIGVIFHHSFFSEIRYGAVNGDPHSVLVLLGSSGWIGVNLFFFLSGFVLYLPYASGSRSISSGRAMLDFYSNRAKRLLPLYYISTIFFIIFVVPLKLNYWGFYRTLFDHLTVTYVFQKETFFPVANWVLWSLGVEIWFSVLFPFLVFAIKRFGWPRMLVYVMLIALATRLLGRLYYIDAARPVLNFVSDSVIGRLDEFLMGMFGAWVYVQRKFTSNPKTQLFVGASLLGACLMLWSAWYRGNFPYPVAGFFNILLDVGFLAVVNSILMKRNFISKIVCSWPLQMLGLMCYSLYIWHGIILRKYWIHALSISVYYIGYILITIMVAWVSYRFIEFRNISNWMDLIPGRIGKQGIGGADISHTAAATLSNASSDIK